MEIPQKFTEAIRTNFYDKTVTKYNVIDTVDSYGFQRKSGTTQTDGTFLANVWFDNFEQLQKDIGIEIVIDIAMTTNEEISEGQIVGYGGYQYKIMKSLKRDSHYLLVGQKWLSKSSTSISA